MKVLICVLIALFGVLQADAKQVKVVGEIENHKFIDRALVYAPPNLNDEVSRTLTFPPVRSNKFKRFDVTVEMSWSLQNGPIRSNFVITGYKQIDEGDSPDVQVVSGGIGSKHISMILTADIGKPLATTFQFYGDKIHNWIAGYWNWCFIEMEFDQTKLLNEKQKFEIKW